MTEELLTTGKIALLPEASQVAADRSYLDTIVRLCDGLDEVLKAYGGSAKARRQEIARLWRAAMGERE